MMPMLQPQFVDWVKNGDHSKPVRDSTAIVRQQPTGPERPAVAALPSPPPETGVGEAERAEVQPQHVQAIEDAITSVGHPLHDVARLDMGLADECHAAGVRDAGEAFQLAFWVNGIAKGYFTPEDLADIYGEEVAQISERISDETVGGPLEHGASAPPEGVTAGPGVPAGGAEGTATEPTRLGEEVGVGEGPGPDVGPAASTGVAGGTKAAGAAPVAERPTGEAGAERPEPAHGRERPAAEPAAGRPGERN